MSQETILHYVKSVWMKVWKEHTNSTNVQITPFKPSLGIKLEFCTWNRSFCLYEVQLLFVKVRVFLTCSWTDLIEFFISSLSQIKWELQSLSEESSHGVMRCIKDLLAFQAPSQRGAWGQLDPILGPVFVKSLSNFIP